MTRRYVPWLALALVIASACATAGPPFPLTGNLPSFRRLAGTWDGTFFCRDGDVSGSLLVTIRDGERYGHGELRMQVADGPPRVLSVRFLWMRGSAVQGELAPFVDPACDCRAETTFTGTLRDDRLVGRYTTRLPNGSARGGRWHADRRVRQRGWFHWR
jgi:hypothetical protein